MNPMIKLAENVRVSLLKTGNRVDQQYLGLCDLVLNTGEECQTRNSIVTKTFGHKMEFDHADGFPIPTAKKTLYEPAIAEMTAFIRGYRSNKKFVDLGCNVWKGNCNASYWLQNPSNQNPGDDLGRIYGVQWRNWDGGIDQLQDVVDTIRTNPNDRRMLVSSWNPGELNKMALPPCPVLFQFFVRDGKYLDISLYQRSADLFLGVPFDIVGYAYLQMVVAKLTDYKPGKFVYFLGDTHIYNNHKDAVKKMLKNRLKTHRLPRAYLNWPHTDMSVKLETFSPEDFTFIDKYKHCGFIKAEMVV